MANTHSNLASLFADIADAIRTKTGGTAAIVADQFPSAISSIKAGGDVTWSGATTSQKSSVSIEGLSSEATYIVVTTSSCSSWAHMGAYTHLLDKGVITALGGKVAYHGSNAYENNGVNGSLTFSSGKLSYYYTYNAGGTNKQTEVTLTAIQIA